MGEVELLWTSATNPAVSLPDLERILRRARRQRLTATRWDAVSKQPRFKLSAVRVERIG